jgi:signal transduction histidine kinase
MKYILFLLPVLFYCHGHAQKKGQPLIDSLLAVMPAAEDDSNKVKLLMRVAQTHMLANPREGFGYAEKGLQLAEKLNWKPGIANLHNTLGLLIGDTGNNTLARTHFEQSYALNKELGSKFTMISNLNNIGRSYQRESDFSNATEYYFMALAIAEDIKSSEQIALVATNITATFYSQKNYPKAAEYAELALKNGEQAKAPNQIGKALMQLGVIKLDTKDSVGAKLYLAKALEVYTEMGNKLAMAQVLSNMADLEYPDYKKEIEVMTRAQNIYDEIGPASIGSISNMDNLGQTYYTLALESKAPDKAAFLKRSEIYLLHALALCRQTSNAELLADVSLALTGIEEERRNYRAALEYYKTYYTTNDSLFSQKKKNEIAGLEGKHDIDQKNNELAINRLMLSNQRKTQIGLIIGLLLTGIIAGLSYRQSRNRKRTNTTLMVLNNQLDEANKIKARFFGILSHDLRSPVANLINFLHLQKNDPELLNERQPAGHQQKISQSAENLLATMETMLLWSKEQMESFKPEVKTVAVSDLFDYIQKFFGQSEKVTISFGHEPGLVVSTDENYLRVIMQNLTSNAIKALKNTAGARIDWNAWKDGDSIVFSVADNGPGIDEGQIKTLYEDSVGVNAKNGFGLLIIRDLANAIHYKITVQSQQGIGTTFTLSS